MRFRRPRAMLGALVIVSAWWPLVAGVGDRSGLQQPVEPGRPGVDLVVLDAAGRVPETLDPADLSVTVGGRPRSVAWVRRVSRGPGAIADAAARRERNGSVSTRYLAEPQRMVLVVVDEGSLPMGGERPVIQSAAAFVDRLGLNDQVGIVRLPQSASQRPSLGSDRAALRSAISRVAGRIPPEGLRTDGVTPDSAHVSGNPMGARISREEEADRPQPVAGGDSSAEEGGINGLIRVLASVSSVPGRKVVAFYSSGLDERTAGRIAAAARASAEARAVLYVFAVPVPRDARRTWFDPRLLAQLARATGGAVVHVTGRPTEGLDSLTPELDACYQVGFAPDPDDQPALVGELRVESRRKGLVIRAPGFVSFRTPASGDIEPPVADRGATPAAVGSPEAYRGAGRLASGGPPASPATPASNPEADRIVGRLGDYAQAWIGQYSAVVAEEDYRQMLPAERRERRLRSDLLFVWSEAAREWVSFRDVFEVDGKLVRDRDTRLQDLFLAPKPDGRAQLQAIKDESARFNIGPFERNINVPLYLLKIFAPAYRAGFSFSVDGSSESAGVRTWQVSFLEHGRPTLVQDRQGGDIPLKGSFLVEQSTGAIVRASVSIERRDYGVSIVARFARDPKLGLWLPAELDETYTVPLIAGAPGRDRTTVLSGTARYSNFRRFQVTTDTQLAPKK